MSAGRLETLEYGDGHLAVRLPADAVVLRPGLDLQEPPPLEDPVAATQEALLHPHGMAPIREMVGARSKVVIAFPDRVKGGSHDTAHRKVAINLVLDELQTAGVRDGDITLVCAIGLHRKNHEEDYRDYLGTPLLERTRGMHLVNHDAEDPEGMVELGVTEDGDVVDVNRAVVEADLAIVLGHAQGNPYGGFSGGYKTICTGLTGWRSIRSHHVPATMHRLDFVPASVRSHFRSQLRRIGEKIEAAMRVPFFALDAVLDSSSRQLLVAAGAVSEVERATWPLAARRTDVVLSGDPFDCLVLGMPRNFHYGPGMGSNPVLMLQAIGAWVIRTAGALSPDAAVICGSICDGWFNDKDFPAYHEVYEHFIREECSPARLRRHEEEVCTRPEYVHAYREAYSHHPFHAFSMLNMGSVAQLRASAIYIVGAKQPEYAERLRCVPVDDFEEALAAARRQLGRQPRLLVIPELSRSAVHVRLASEVTRTA